MSCGAPSAPVAATFIAESGSEQPASRPPTLAERDVFRGIHDLHVASQLSWALRRSADALVIGLAHAARAVVSREISVEAGYMNPGDFTREQLSRSDRWLRELARLATGLETIPALAPAIRGDDGAAPLGRVAATCIAHVATPESGVEWIALARRVSVRELRQQIRTARERGSAHPIAQQHVVDFDHRAAGQPFEADTAHPQSVQVPAVPDVIGQSCPERTTVLDDEPPTTEIRLVVPYAIRVAFDETRRLHHAVSGHETDVTSFVEALVAETAAGPHPPDIERVPLRKGTSLADLEAALDRSRSQSKHRADVHLASDLEFATAFDLTTDFDASARGTPTDDAPSNSSHMIGETWEVQSFQEVREQCVAALRRRLELEAEANDPSTCPMAHLLAWIQLEEQIEHCLGRLLAAIGQQGGWRSLGYSGAGHYAEECLGLPRRTFESRAGIVRALRDLPSVRKAHASGRIGLEAAWLLRRAIGTGSTHPLLEDAWVAHAEGATIKRLRDDLHLVDLSRFGLLPQPPSHADVLDPELPQLPTAALMPGAPRSRSVAASMRPVLPPSDDDWLAGILRIPGQTVLRVFALGPRGLDRGMADVFLRLRLPDDLASAFLATVESERRRLEKIAAAMAENPEPEPALREPAGSAALRAAREFVSRCRRVPAWVGLLAVLEDYVCTWDDPRSMPKREWEATYARDGYRCMAPGCTARRIEDHHIVYRSERGSNSLWNQLSGCPFHHRQGEHGEFARVRGTAPGNLIWRIGRKPYATYWKNERRLGHAPERAAAIALKRRLEMDHSREAVAASRS